MTTTAIQWTDETWNPVVGCSVVSEGCKHCYAERMDKRLRGIASEEWRPWTAPNAEYNVRLHPERLETPLHWRKPRRVFVNSMSDLFHERVPDEFIDRVFAVMALSPQHTFQVLTKRPERMLVYLTDVKRYGKVKYLANEGPEVDAWFQAKTFQQQQSIRRQWWARLPPEQWPLKNVWLGVSCEDQRRADERIPLLLQTPASVRFISAEPLLGPIDLTDVLSRVRVSTEDVGESVAVGFEHLLDWVIVGGESGPGARPCDVGWVRAVVEQSRAAGVSCFVKQLGAKPTNDGDKGLPGGDRWPTPNDAQPTKGLWQKQGETYYRILRDSHGGDPSEWPADLRVREFPR